MTNTAEQNVESYLDSNIGADENALCCFLDNQDNYKVMQKSLIYSVVDRLGTGCFLESYEKINTDGFDGFSSHADTMDFYSENRLDLLAWLKRLVCSLSDKGLVGFSNTGQKLSSYGIKEVAEVVYTPSVIGLLKQNDQLLGYSIDDIAEAIYNPDTDKDTDSYRDVASLVVCIVTEQVCHDFSKSEFGYAVVA